MAKYSLEQIKSAYIQKKEWEKQFSINYFLIRPLSFYITYLALKMTRNPATVAMFGFAFGALGCFSLAFSSIWSLWPGILLVLLYSISDAVDGNIARTTQNVTLFGKYLDGVLGDLIDGNYLFFLGIGLYFSESSIYSPFIIEWAQGHERVIPLFLGSFILICKLWAVLFETRYDTYRIKKEGLAPFDELQVKKVINRTPQSAFWYNLVFLNLSCLNNQLFLLVILVLLKLEIWFLIFFTCFFTAKAFLYFIFYFRKTKAKLSEPFRPV